MENKKNLLYNILYVSIYVVFALATIFVLIFEFSALEFAVITALVLYVIAFGVLTVAQCLGVIELKKLLKQEAEAGDKKPQEPAEAENNGNQEVVAHAETLEETRKKITWGYVKAVLSAIVCVFAFVVLVLF